MLCFRFFLPMNIFTQFFWVGHDKGVEMYVFVAFWTYDQIGSVSIYPKKTLPQKLFAFFSTGYNI